MIEGTGRIDGNQRYIWIASGKSEFSARIMVLARNVLPQRQIKRPGIFPGLVCCVDGLMD
jgi:hypothetical protein